MLKQTVIGLLMATMAGAPAAAQSTGTIHGTVRDPQGGAIAGARVRVRCGNDVRDVTASPAGEFQASGLPLATCDVMASSSSFESETTVANAGSAAPVRFVLGIRRFASEVVVTPARGEEESTMRVPETVSVTSRGDIDQRPYTLFTQVLREEPGILLQQTTSAQVSPIIRGFTGQSNVYVFDGVRFNVSSWRSGPSQYVAWIDGGPVDTIEVIRGSGSVQYGSDALGGTIQMRSTPVLGGVQAPAAGFVELTAASGDRMVGGQADVSLHYGTATIRVGGSRRSVGDLRAGKGLDSRSAVTRFLGQPSTILGTRQQATGYDQGGVYGVADVGLGRHGTLRGVIMHEDQEGASRYDRVLGGEGLFRSGFEPQTLDFGLIRYSVVPARFLDGLTGTFSVNKQADGRFEQSRPTARVDRQEATTTAFGYQLQGNRDFGSRHQLSVGTEYYDESIDAVRELVETNGTIQLSRPDIPDGTSYSTAGLFAQHRVDVIPDRLSVRGGARFSRFVFATTPDVALGVIAQRETMQSATFQAAAVLTLTEQLNLTGSVNRGFRAANAADLGSVGLTGGGGFEITPSTANELGAFIGTTGATGAVSTGERAGSLKPEIVYQYELGLKGHAGVFAGSINGFDMELYDFIQRRALVFDPGIVGTTISGFEVTSVDATGLAYIAQDIRPIATRSNTDRGRIRGFDTEGEARIGPWTGRAYFSMANGKALTTDEFLRRMPPPMGGAQLRWTRDQLWVEGVMTFAREQTRFNSGDLTDARIGATRTRTSIATFFNGTATDMGLVSNGILVATGETLAQVQTRVLGSANSAPLFTSHPGFVTWGLRGGVRLARHIDVMLLGENLTDKNYRLFGSGVDALGRNVQVRTRLRF